jgi:hypothetical protein
MHLQVSRASDQKPHCHYLVNRQPKYFSDTKPLSPKRAVPNMKFREKHQTGTQNQYGCHQIKNIYFPIYLRVTRHFPAS